MSYLSPKKGAKGGHGHGSVPVSQGSTLPVFGLVIKQMAVPGPALPTLPRKAAARTSSRPPQVSKPVHSLKPFPPTKRAEAVSIDKPNAVVVVESTPSLAAPDPVDPAPPQEEPPYSVVCRFNHYKSSFPCINGAVRARDIDEEYCFSHVYKGERAFA